MGVWIETENRDEVGQDLNVTPCVGVWIETENQQKPYTTLWVTPCVGVWIETAALLFPMLQVLRSHPAWVCGLKQIRYMDIQIIRVTPCVGVWIETLTVI